MRLLPFPQLHTVRTLENRNPLCLTLEQMNGLHSLVFQKLSKKKLLWFHKKIWFGYLSSPHADSLLDSNGTHHFALHGFTVSNWDSWPRKPVIATISLFSFFQVMTCLFMNFRICSCLSFMVSFSQLLQRRVALRRSIYYFKYIFLMNFHPFFVKDWCRS